MIVSGFCFVLIPYGAFGFHAGVSRTRPIADTLSRLFSRTQFTTATRYTLSYIRGRGLTYIYTRREEVPEGPSGDKIKIAVPP